ncbi:tRNA-specific adenosine deaminase 1 [Nannizzia gypsea CBS 118893]|uniref:tRNA-specific adenosine deaminase 1 n=1 Tax=Arthroderma gypseum (strain ATCC MYA-4604 / CBS 118893) TaxID=535722 RepID=E5R3V6_ARTGP|nr:tRNA-specific adenosine deaminase 1 [Nannizzia gypsea CBS 118893]EFQ98016.1 tRNA-specific adenosine deaminase 1 [Nannizzia gypsea CBS 118893]
MCHNHPSLERRVASLVHAHFEALPQRSKPTIHGNGLREWIPLSGIVLVTKVNTPEEALTCVAVATGAKCLPSSQIAQCSGLVLHDSHAEILTLRAFNHWLLEECKSVLTEFNKKHVDNSCAGVLDEINQGSGDPLNCFGSRFLQWNLENTDLQEPIPWPPFRIKEDVKIWMYCSCAPCGDASMELCMAAQEDPTPWKLYVPETSNTENPGSQPQGLLNGRAHFSILGAVRRKPSRADAESTLSKSCSDKLAVKQATSILSFPTSLLVVPTSNAYISNIVLPAAELNRTGCDRSFGSGESGRMRPLNGRTWGTGHKADACFKFRPFEMTSLPMEEVEGMWKYGKPTAKSSEEKVKTGNVSAVWTAPPSNSPRPPFTSKWNDIHSFSEPGGYKEFFRTPPTNLNETLINGVKQGYRLNSPGFKKASALSRARMWALLGDISKLLDEGGLVSEQLGGTQTSSLTQIVHSAPSYGALKSQTAMGGYLQARAQVLQDVRLVLNNWIRNYGDDTWDMSVFDIPAKAKRQQLQSPKES